MSESKRFLGVIEQASRNWWTQVGRWPHAGVDLQEQRQVQARGARRRVTGAEVDGPRRPFCRETAGVRRDALHSRLPGLGARSGNGASRLRRPCTAAVLALRLQWRVKARVCCARLGRAEGRGGRLWEGLQPVGMLRSPAASALQARPRCRSLQQGGLQSLPSALRAFFSWVLNAFLKPVDEGLCSYPNAKLRLICPGR